MADSLFSVRDQTVLVSGGSRGIGRGLAAGFASRGAKVVITGRDQPTLRQTADDISTGDHKVRPIVCDVVDAAARQNLVEQVMADFGHIDTLLNVAGINQRQPAETYTEAEYDRIVDTNLRSAFLLSQLVGRHMIEHGRGSQINIVSLNNDRPLKHVLPYAVSKAGMGQMTRALAMEWGPRGVRVNAIAPGFILTDLTRNLWSEPTMKAWGEANTPLVRLGHPEDLVGAAIFLASKASAFMTGQTIFVDGGMSAGMMWPIE